MIDCTAPNEELATELQTYSGHLAAATCQWLEGVAEFDRRNADEQWGVTSCSHWLQLWCGLDARSARDKLRVARRLQSLPRTTELFREGRLSYSKVRALSRMADSSTEASLADMALDADTAQLEKLVRLHRRHLVNDQLTADRRNMSWRQRDDGMEALNMVLSPEEAVAIRTAVEAMQVRMVDHADGSAEPPATAFLPSAIDAFLALVEASHLAKTPVSAEEALVTVHLDVDSEASLADGTGLTQATARRLMCDAVLQPLLKRNDEPLRMGRRHRLIKGKTRRAIYARDRSCRYPACINRRFLHAHHVKHWLDGGRSDPDNVLLLCGHHHRALHNGLFRIVRSAGRFLFFSPETGEIAGQTMKGDGASLVTKPFLHPLPSAAERMDYHYTSAVMWAT